MFLKGYRLLDMCWMGGGPFTAQVLGDLGFDVIKIMEVAKAAGRRGGQDSGFLIGINNPDQLSYFRFGIRNARSIRLDLKSAAGLRVFHRLVEKADALQEGFRPGVADRLGVGYEALRQINPRLVYAAITSFGQTGPYRNKAAHDINFESIAGFIGLNGRPGGSPVIPGALVADCGLSAVVHILAALLRRERTGQGAYCDVSLTDSIFEMTGFAVNAFLASGKEPQRGDMYYSGRWPFCDVYETKGGEYISIGAWEPYFYANLCRTLGREDLIELQYSVERRDYVRQEFTRIFKSKTQAEWVETFDGVDACFTPVNSVSQAVADPQMRARNMVVELENPVHGQVPAVGSMLKLDGTPLTVQNWMFQPGQHTDEILEEHGFSTSQITELREDNVVG